VINDSIEGRNQSHRLSRLNEKEEMDGGFHGSFFKSRPTERKQGKKHRNAQRKVERSGQDQVRKAEKAGRDVGRSEADQSSKEKDTKVKRSLAVQDVGGRLGDTEEVRSQRKEAKAGGR